MSSKARYILAVLIAAGMWLGSGSALHADVAGRPHDLGLDNSRGHCINCHDLHQTGLGEGFEHNLKRANEMEVCYQCHAGAMNDYSSIDPTMPSRTSLYSYYDIRSEFGQSHIHFPRYGMDGEHNKCSQCHNPHGVFDPATTTRKPKLLSAGPDGVTDTDEYCFVCHNKDANPPHAKFPNISVGMQYRISRTMYRQMTHSTFFRATTITEPVLDIARTYDDNPYGKGKDISCLTCHRPHGSPNEHMLNAADNQDFCLACHNGSKAPSMTRFTSTGHGKAGVGRICQECHFPHGTGQENAVKTTIRDPHTATDRNAFVNLSGMNAACFACHNSASSAVYTTGFSDVSGWWNFYYMSLDRDATVGHGAPGSLKQWLSGYYISYDNFSQVEIGGIKPNTRYTFSGYLYLPRPVSGGRAFLRVTEFPFEYSYGGIAENFIPGDQTTGGVWKYQSLTFTTTASTTRVRLRLKLSGEGTAYWDDLKLAETPYASSYFPGKGVYKAGLHSAAHNPKDTTGDQSPGDCGNCHDPHGKGNEKMLVDHAETLCYDCHNETTPNTASGRDVKADFQMASHHDLSQVSCARCHNPHTATRTSVMMEPYDNLSEPISKTTFCMACHSGMMPDRVTGAPDVGKYWIAGGHYKTMTLGCPDCHTNHGSVNVKNLNYSDVKYGGYTARFAPGMTFADRSFCEACHNRTAAGFKGAKRIPTGDGSVGQHLAGDATSCSVCHKLAHDPTLADYTGNRTYYTVYCLDCHTTGVGNPYPDTDTEFNTPRDGVSDDKMRSVHPISYNPPGTVDCTVCHSAKHETDHGASSMLKDPDPFHGVSGVMPDVRTSSVLCIECHDGTPVNIGGRTPQNILATYTAAGHGMASARVACYTCHQYHGSRSEKLLNYTVAGSAVLPIYSGNNVMVCVPCHRGYDKRTPQWSGYGVYSSSIHAFGNFTTGNFVTDGRHGAGVCVNCHNPHGSKDGGKNTGSMLYKEGEELCYNCHNQATPNTASGEDVQARFGMNTHHRISDADQIGPDGIPGTDDDAKIECVSCHDPHTITTREMAFKDISDINGKRVVPEAADQAFCIKCHSANPPSGVKYPKEGVWDKSKYLESAHGNPMKRIRTFSNYSNGISYPCKYCHHPHGSEQAAQQRESWDIDRDGIPDDIDGDGILDSTDMVGFIGYSTGTRMPILVNTTSGIPSRHGFRHVSSTIPYQANGTIDVEVCFNCHDGSPAPDVETDFNKRSHHDVTYADQVASGGSKIECYNCHDQHRAQARDDASGEYATTNPEGQREPMPGDAAFCLKCHDNTLPPNVSFGAEQLKNVKLSYNPNNYTDGKGYDIVTTFIGHYVQDDGKALMCRDCHNQHGSGYEKLLRDDTEPGKPGHNASEPVQKMSPVALRSTDPFSGGDDEPLTTTTERCLTCHSGATRFNGKLLPLPPPPDAAERGFDLSPVGKHPDLKAGVTYGNGYEALDARGGKHIYSPTFALITAPGSVKESCIQCHDSHNPYIATVEGQLMDCYQCHNENTALPDVQSEFNDNPTNPARSRSIHPIKYDPTGTTPAFLECLKCHDQTKHMQGHIRLRKDPGQFHDYTSDDDVWVDPFKLRKAGANQFCLECHAPDTTVAASFHRGGSEHVPPKLPAGHLNGAHFVNGTLLCTDCHEYHGSKNLKMRKNARGEEESFCYSCHTDKDKSQNKVDVQFKFMSTASHHQVKQSEQSANGSKVECEDCHNPHVVTRAAPVVNVNDKTAAAPSDNMFCIACHDQNGGPGVRFPGFATGTSAGEWNTSTGRWNRWDKSGYINSSSAHNSRGGVLCKTCHDPHGSTNYGLLPANMTTAAGKATGIKVGFGMHSTIRGKRKEELGVNSFCAACHKDSTGVYEGYVGFTSLTFGKRHGVDKNCTYCHNPHGTNGGKLIRSTRPLYMNMTSRLFGSMYNFKGFGNQTTGAPYYVFCSSAGCHASERAQVDTFNMDLPVDNFTRDETRSSHHPIKEGVVGCVSCHKEHGSGFAPDLRAPFFRESGWPKLFHSGRGRYGNHSNSCDNRDVWDGSDYFEGGSHASQVNAVNPPTDADALCLMCHQREDVIGDPVTGMAGTNTRFLGHESVKGGAKDSFDLSYYGNAVGSEYHNFSCAACHFPHSSSRGKLLKQGCFSQLDGQYPSSKIWGCHAYNRWGSPGNLGWRNLTTSSNTDFNRPPNAVADLSASLDSDLTVHMSWTAVADAPGQGAHHYNVYRSTQALTQAGKPYATRIFKGVAGGAAGSAVSYTDLTCQPGTTYYYAVVACDAQNNESFVSNYVSVTTGADTYAPAAISDQEAYQDPGTFKVKVTWHDPGDNVNAIQYRVYRKSGLTPLADSDRIEGNRKTTVTDTSLSADGSPDGNLYSYIDTTTVLGQDYSYAVAAADAAGNLAPVPTGNSYGVSIVDPAPAAITGLAAKPVTGEMKSSLTWSAPINEGTIRGYNLYRKESSPLAPSELVAENRIMSCISGTSCTDDLPATGVTYYYKVTAIDDSSSKESAASNDASVYVPTPPASFTAVALQDSRAQLNWAAPSYATNFTNYKVYLRRDSGSWAQISHVDNLAPGAGFENGFEGWSVTSLVASGSFQSGKACASLSAKAAGDKFIQSGWIDVSPSTSYVYTGMVYVPVALTGGNTALRVIEYNSANGYVTEHTATGVTQNSGWQLMTDTWTTQPSTTKVLLRVQLQGAGTAYWYDVRFKPTSILSSSAKVDLTGLEPGDYELAVTANYSAQGGTTPYESVKSGYAALTVADTLGPDFASASSHLTSGSGYNRAAVEWTAPTDRNFSGHQASGMDYYRIEASYDKGNTWGTMFKSRLSDPGFEAYTGTPDDGVMDTFSAWQPAYVITQECDDYDCWDVTTYNTQAYSVSDALLDKSAAMIKWSGTGERHIYATEPDTGQSVASKEYSMSFWAKANRPGVTLGYYIQENGGGLEKVGETNTTVGTGWQRFTVTGTFTSGATARAARAVLLAPADTADYIILDGVRLEAGTGALDANDGSFYRPADYNVPASPQSFDDPKDLPPGTSAIYRIKAVDTEGNSATVTTVCNAKPTAIADLSASSAQTTSGNIVTFTTQTSQSGITKYRVYAKKQAGALTASDLTEDNRIGTITAHTPSLVDLSRNATASSNSSYDGYYYPPSLVLDGSTTTYWEGGDNTAPKWLELDLGSASPLYRVSFHFYPNSAQNRPMDYLVQTYDGTDWVTQVTVTGNSAETRTHAFYRPVSASRVRIYITESAGRFANHNIPVISEFNVYTGEEFVHDLHNTALMAEVGSSYAYAVIAEDTGGILSDISGGQTVNAVVDKDAPEKVTDLASVSPVGTTQVQLSWTKPMDNLGFGAGTGATRYEIYRMPTSSIGTPAAVTDDNFGSASLVYTGDYTSEATVNYTATWYDLKTVFYGVRSRDASGNWSVISNSPPVTVGKDIEPPTPPVITECVPSVSPDVDVYWLASLDNVGINKYVLYRADFDAEPFKTDKCITENNIFMAAVAIPLIPYSSTSAADSTGLPGKTYYYALRAWDENDTNVSNISNCVVATVRTTASDSAAPVWAGTPLTVEQGPYPDIDLRWTHATDKDDYNVAGSIDHYEIFRSLDSFSSATDPGVTNIGTVAGIRDTYVDNTGVHDTTYYYGLIAVDASGNRNRSALSNVGSAAVATPLPSDNVSPTLPTNLAVSTGVYPNMNLSWTASTDVDDPGNPQPLLYYKLYRAEYPLVIDDTNKNDADHVRTTLIAHDSINYVDRGIGGRTYNYRLEAFDLAGNPSGLSAGTSGTVADAPCTDTTKPLPPTALNALAGPSPDMYFTWTAASDDLSVGCYGEIDHYRLYRDTTPITASTDLKTLLAPQCIAGNSTSYIDSSGRPNTTYYYVMTAVDSSNNESVKSGIVSRATAADMMAPAAITDLKAHPMSQAMQLTWCKPSDNVGIDHYEIYRKAQLTIMTDGDVNPANKAGDFTNHGVCLTYNDTGLEGGTTYSYAVISVDGAGNRSTISRGLVTGDTVKAALP